MFIVFAASPEIDSKSDSVEFGSFLAAPVSTAAATTTAPTTVATASAPSTTGASSDLADLDFFSGSVSQTGGSTSGGAATSSGQATKDDILALYGPSSSSNMFGVPG